ncbi:hypothetical protein Q5P01_004290 [Channa striata]|uniref:non-specific serine/threonine protein kinase n=1 Tax=Channa striata TaxID=64152 RepID=A0AA88NU84_CHASR|nr:hypothetical protein Q5P01_004290 [Channa striata]
MVLKAGIEQDSLRRWQKFANGPTKEELHVVNRTWKKEKSTSEGEVLRKILRCHSNNTCSDELEVAVMVKISKRKASTPVGAQSKKLRCENNCSGESVDRASETGLLKTSFEQIPAAKTTTTTKRGCDVLPGSSGLSASRMNNGCVTLSGKNSKADFEANYLQLDKLGEGGFGTVYAGFRKKDSFPVAIKHISRKGLEHLTTVQNGVKYTVPTEVFLLLKVAGQESVGKTAVVSLLDWYDLEEKILVVMERPMPAVDLLTFLETNNGPLKEDTCKIIMKQLVEAAVHIHSQGVFHRDIKLENVLIQTTVDGLQVRVIDFGCGCLSNMGPFRKFAGTSAYVPPEYLLFGEYNATPTTVWQLGALLYEITDGYKVFEKTTVLQKSIQFNEELSKECQDFLHRCLAVNPKARIPLDKMLLHCWLT